MIELHMQNSSVRVYSKAWEEFFGAKIKLYVASLNELVTGDILVKVVTLLQACKGNATKLIKALGSLTSQSDSLDQVTFDNLVEFRHREVAEFNMFRSKLKAFLQFCTNFKQYIYLEDLEAELKSLTVLSVDERKLSSLCQPVAFGKIKTNFRREVPLVTYFSEFNKSKLDKMEKLIELDRLKCAIFDSLFVETCVKFVKEMEVVTMPIDRLLNQALPLIFTKWQQIAVNIDSGKIKLVEIDDYLSKYFNNHEHKLIAELNYIMDKSAIKNSVKRKEALVLYFRFKASVETARVIEDIRVSLKMTSKFTELNELLSIKEAQFNEWTITKMDENVDVIRSLDKICSYEKLSCLKAFNQSIALVEWLRANLKDIKELKFLIDLASIAKTADSSQTYKKDLLAKVLKESCIAFAPLIFELKANDTFKRFVSLCDVVWSNLESDRNIGEKLLEVNNKLPSLKELRDKKGT